jgi:hypothetical protein
VGRWTLQDPLFRITFVCSLRDSIYGYYVDEEPPTSLSRDSRGSVHEREREAGNAAMEENARVIKGIRKELKAVKEAIEDIPGIADEGLTAKQMNDMRRVVARRYISLIPLLISLTIADLSYHHFSFSPSLIPLTVTYTSHHHLPFSPSLISLTTTYPSHRHPSLPPTHSTINYALTPPQLLPILHHLLRPL